MKRINNPIQNNTDVEKAVETFTAFLSDGREINFRGVIAKDLLVLEKQSMKSPFGDMERGIRLAERLSLAPNKLSRVDIESMGVKDFRIISDLIAQASGLTTEDLGND